MENQDGVIPHLEPNIMEYEANSLEKTLVLGKIEG